MATKKAAKKTAVTTENTEETLKPAAKKTAAKKTAAKKTGEPTAETTSVKASETKKTSTSEEVAKLAHRYWEQRGRSHGSHVEDWLRAEKELNS